MVTGNGGPGALAIPLRAATGAPGQARPRPPGRPLPAASPGAGRPAYRRGCGAPRRLQVPPGFPLGVAETPLLPSAAARCHGHGGTRRASLSSSRRAAEPAGLRCFGTEGGGRALAASRHRPARRSAVPAATPSCFRERDPSAAPGFSSHGWARAAAGGAGQLAVSPGSAAATPTNTVERINLNPP